MENAKDYCGCREQNWQYWRFTIDENEEQRLQNVTRSGIGEYPCDHCGYQSTNQVILKHTN